MKIAQAQSEEPSADDVSALRRTLILFARQSGFFESFKALETDAGDRRTLFKQLSNSLNRFLNPEIGVYWEMPREVGELRLTSLEVHPGKAGLVVFGDWPAPFWFSVAQVIQNTAHLVRRCPAANCGAVFVRNRRQEHCSPTCNNRERQRRSYQAHRNERIDRRHEAYKRRIHKRQPRARVRRRRRAG